MVGALLPMFLSFGMNSSITYLTASRKFTSSNLLYFSIISSILLSIIGGFVFYFAYTAFLSTSFLEGINSIEIFLVLAVLPINLLMLFLTSIIQGKQQLLAFNLVNILRVISNLGFQIISALLHAGVIGAIIAWLLSNFVALIVTLWLLRSDFTMAENNPRRITRPALSYGIKSYIANLFTFFNYRLDSFLVNFYAGAASVGLYSVSVSTAELIWYIPNSISSALFPKSSTIDKGTAANLTAQACRQTLVVSSLLALFLAVTGPFLIPFIYGDNFQDAVPAFLWLLPGILSVSLSKIISANLSGTGKPQYTTYTSAITVVITIALDIALIPLLGIVGAAIASSIAYIASAILSVWWFSRETHTNWLDVIIPKRDDLSILLKQTQKLVNNWIK